VIVSYVVQTDGSVADPLVVDSSGIGEFEKAALRTVSRWTYEPATQNGKPVEQCQTKSQIAFKIETREQGARKTFARRYNKIYAFLKEGDLDQAETWIDETMERGEWNLYEYSRIWLLKSMLARQRGDEREQLAALYRSIGKKGEYVDQDLVAAVLPLMLQLELKLSEYSAAIETFEQMKKLSPIAQEYEPLVAAANELIKMVDSDQILSVPATIAPCDDCPGRWTYEPLRREFAFTNVNGELQEFELRCDWRRYRQAIDPELSWKIPESWGKCQLQVVGDTGTHFDFVEFATTGNVRSNNAAP
jgi:TonB family protein